MKSVKENLIANVVVGVKKNAYTDRRKKNPRVYLTFPNADKVSSIGEMFMSRYNKPSKGVANIVKNSLADYLMNQVIESNNNSSDYNHLNSDKIKSCIKLSWNQYAGCSCPCSPGYIMSFNNNASLPYVLLKYEEFLVNLNTVNLPII